MRLSSVAHNSAFSAAAVESGVWALWARTTNGETLGDHDHAFSTLRMPAQLLENKIAQQGRLRIAKKMRYLSRRWPIPLHYASRAPGFLLPALVVGVLAPSVAADSLEEAVCGDISEPFAFLMWSGAAGAADNTVLEGVPNGTKRTFRTKDGRTLHGFRLSAEGNEPPRGSLLFVQGNAMLADQVLTSLRLFSKAGLDVYVYDFRGYGNSEGKRRLKAMVSDYAELSAHVSRETPGKRHFYGVSYGGLLLLNSLRDLPDDRRLVIDSTPSRISDRGCPESFDPVANVPKNSKGVLVIAAKHDRVVPPAQSKELADAVVAAGGRSLLLEDSRHPFQDVDVQAHIERMRLVASFLLDQLKSP